MTETKQPEEDNRIQTSNKSQGEFKRKDANGVAIIKGGKFHKVTFRENKTLLNIVQIKSFKEFNQNNNFNDQEEQVSEVKNSKVSCCVLF